MCDVSGLNGKQNSKEPLGQPERRRIGRCQDIEFPSCWQLCLWAMGFLTAHRVRGNSMDPTLCDGDLVLANPRAYDAWVRQRVLEEIGTVSFFMHCMDLNLCIVSFVTISVHY